VALMTTSTGMLSYLVFGPAERRSWRTGQRGVLVKEIMIEGILSIQGGTPAHPEEKLLCMSRRPGVRRVRQQAAKE